MSKLVDAQTAIAKIPDNATLATAGFVGIGFPEALAIALERVDHLTFSGSYASERGQHALYITERAVFDLTGKGLRLIEIAPGVDLERDVLSQMAFKPQISAELKPMAPELFTE